MTLKILVPLKVPFDPEMTKIGMRLAKIMGAELTFLNVADTRPLGGYLKVQEDFVDKIKEVGEEILKNAVDMAHKEGVEATSKIVEGNPYKEILKAEENADMLVLKIRRFSDDKAVGSVTKDLLEQCCKPLFVFKGKQREFQKILITIDESECSKEALKFALLFTKHLGLGSLSTLFVARSKDKMEIGKKVLEEAAERGAELGIELDTHLEKGDPAKEILKLSEGGYDLIIMGAVGQGTLSKFFLGNVARKVTNFSECDVIVVPPCR